MLIGILHPPEDISILALNHQIRQCAGSSGIGQELIRAAGDTFCGQHIAGCILGAVGDIDSLKAPFIPQNGNLCAAVGRRSRHANAVIAGHYAQTTAVGQSALKCLKINFPAGLLRCKGGNAVAVYLLVIEAVVLKAGDDALFGHGGSVGTAHLVAQEAILREILAVSSQVSSAVNVCAGPKHHGHTCVHGILRHKAAALCRQLQVEGCRLGRLIHIQGTALSVARNIIALNAAGAIGGSVGGLSHCRNRHHATVVTADCAQFADGQLLHKGFPPVIAIGNILHIHQL